jgi:AraC-like DNA-binding protein
VQEILTGAPGDRHSLTALATALGVSPFYLSHVFRSETGTSIHQYLLEVRLAVAHERLAEGVTSLSALALELGFATHSHFTTAFRRRFGVTPREARSVLLKVNETKRSGASEGLPPAA